MNHRFTGKALVLAAITIVPPLTAGTLAAKDAYSRWVTNQQSNVELIESPDQWVPFAAEVTVTYPTGTLIRGRVFRGADGSRRLDTGPSLDDIRIVSITNATHLTGYLYEEGKWGSYSLPRAPVLPRFRKGLSSWHLHPYRLAIRLGEDGSVNGAAGLQAYRVTSQTGTTTLRAPDVNFETVVSMRPDGRFEKLTNLQFVPIPADAFEPPPGATVVPISMPGSGNLPARGNRPGGSRGQ